MSLFSTVRGFISSIIKNPLTALAVAYIVYKVLQKYSAKKESVADALLAERVTVQHLPDGTDVVTDSKTGKAVAVKGTDIRAVKEHAVRFEKLREALGAEDPSVAAEFPMDEFRKGVEVETEHTNDPLQAARIALDHLAEDPQYYTKLATIETPLKEAVKAQLVYAEPEGNQLAVEVKHEQTRYGGYLPKLRL